MPTVSIIIPVYNKEKYIKYTIESILAQTYMDYEVLIINDGSTDNSLEIIKKYANQDNRILVIDISNEGVSNARNIGLKNARGKWIQFLDGDDLIDRDYLKKGIETAELNQVDILFSNFQMIDENKKCIKQVICSYQGAANQETLSKLFIEQQYENGFFGYISNKLIKKSIIETSEAKFKKELKLAEDLDFYAQIYPYVKNAYFSQLNSFFYLQTITNYLNDQNIDYFSQLTVHLDIRKWFIKTGFYFTYKDVLDRKVAEYVFFSLFHAGDNSENIKIQFEKIICDREIMACIEPEKFSGFYRYVLSAVKYKKYYTILILLNGRMFIRTIYRSLRNE